jgi:hypothetical protein
MNLRNVSDTSQYILYVDAVNTVVVPEMGVLTAATALRAAVLTGQVKYLLLWDAWGQPTRIVAVSCFFRLALGLWELRRTET